MTIEYENENLLIIDKPAGLPVYSAPSRQDENSVLSWLRTTGCDLRGVGDPDRPGIVHRLDKQTSGLLILAKDQKTFDYLKKLFQTRQIAKEYTALVYGQTKKHGVIDKSLTKIGHEGQSRVRVDEAGKKSITEYSLIKYYKNELDQFTLVKVKLHTGRTHQIRVHFSSIGHPVMGDNLYGKPQSQKLSPILHRQFLHASKLEFQLPDRTWLEVQSELPDDLNKVLSSLQHN